MEKEKFGQVILEKIKAEHLKPRPQWQFYLKNFVWWLAGVLSLGLGILACALLIFGVRYNDWDWLKMSGGQAWGLIFASLPYAWLILLVIFLLATDYHLKHTKNGYRFYLWQIAAVVLAICFLSGWFLSQSRLMIKLEDKFASKLPTCQQDIGRLQRYWLQPEKGIIAGTIKNLTIDGLVLEDYKTKLWQVKTDHVFIPENLSLTLGDHIKIFGQVNDKKEFSAKEIRLLKVGGCFKCGCQQEKKTERKCGCQRNNK